MAWTPLTFEVVTPLFNDGADQRCDAVRVPALRGALRFWLRATAGRYVGNNLEHLADVERRVFGDTDHPSPIRLRILKPPIPSTEHLPGWVRGRAVGEQFNGVAYLLGPGLHQVAVRSRDQSQRLLRAFLPGLEWGKDPTTFTVDISFSGDPVTDNLFLTALWALVTYGGLGSRVRRGFGTFRLADSNLDISLPGEWQATEFVAPPLKGWAALLETCLPKEVDERLRDALRDVVPGLTREPSSARGHYPQLNPVNWAGALLGEPEKSWTSVLATAGRRWREFRATEPTRGVRYRPELKTWEWLNTVHGPSSDFPIGATGLPIVFKKGDEVAPEVDGKPGRRPSPIWFRPVGHADQWQLATFAFQHRFLPDDVQVRRRVNKLLSGAPLSVGTNDVDAAVKAWLSGQPRPTPAS